MYITHTNVTEIRRGAEYTIYHLHDEEGYPLQTNIGADEFASACVWLYNVDVFSLPVQLSECESVVL